MATKSTLEQTAADERARVQELINRAVQGDTSIVPDLRHGDADRPEGAGPLGGGGGAAPADPVRKLKRARELDLVAPELAECVIQGDLTLRAASRQLPAAAERGTAAGRPRANKRGEGAGGKPRRSKDVLLLPRGTSPAAGRLALAKYFGAEWLGELAGGVSPQPKVAEDPDTAGITAPVAGATLPTPDAAPAVPVNTDAN